MHMRQTPRLMSGAPAHFVHQGQRQEMPHLKTGCSFAVRTLLAPLKYACEYPRKVT
jgi:hypothetical protein